MTSKRQWRVTLIALFFLVIAPQLRAQDSEESRFFRLAWTGDDYALRFEVVIEKEEEDGEYRKILQEFTDTCFIEITLPLGKYRFNVTPYDFLELPGEASQWLDFEVHQLTPEVLEPEPEPELEPEPEPEPELKPFEPEPEPEHIIETPGLFHMYLSAAWMPLLPVYYGGQNQFFGKSPSFAGADIRFGVFYSGFGSINTGLEVEGSWYMFNAAFDGGKDSSHHAISAGINLVAQKRPLNRSIALTFRMGAGLAFLPGIGESVSLEHSFFTNIGVSFQIYISELIYIETGIEHNNWFTKEPSGCLKPCLGIGFQF